LVEVYEGWRRREKVGRLMFQGYVYPNEEVMSCLRGRLARRMKKGKGKGRLD